MPPEAFRDEQPKQSVWTNFNLRDGNVGASPTGEEAAWERAISPAGEEQPPGPGPPQTSQTEPEVRLSQLSNL